MTGSEITRKLAQQNQTTLLRRVGDLTQARVAELSGISTTLVSRMLSGKDNDDVERVLALLSACNLVLVPREFKHIDPDEYRALQVLAQKRLVDAAADSDWGQLS